MKQTICDVCNNAIIEDSEMELKISTNRIGCNYEDICKHCSEKIYKTIRDIKERPREACKECGTMSSHL